jgi:uncharacterized membrane protein YqjE
MPMSTNRSVPDIVSDLLTQFTALASTHTRLARVEMSEKVGQVTGGLALVVGAAVLLIPALVVLLQAAVAALERAGFAPPISSLIVGGAALVIGLILLMIGLSRLKADNMVPHKTIHQLWKDASVAKRQVRPDHDDQRAA